MAGRADRIERAEYDLHHTPDGDCVAQPCPWCRRHDTWIRRVTWVQWLGLATVSGAACTVGWLSAEVARMHAAQRAAQAAGQVVPDCGSSAVGELFVIGCLLLATLIVAPMRWSAGPRWVSYALLGLVGALWAVYVLAPR